MSFLLNFLIKLFVKNLLPNFYNILLCAFCVRYPINGMFSIRGIRTIYQWSYWSTGFNSHWTVNKKRLLMFTWLNCVIDHVIRRVTHKSGITWIHFYLQYWLFYDRKISLWYICPNELGDIYMLPIISLFIVKLEVDNDYHQRIISYKTECTCPPKQLQSKQHKSGDLVWKYEVRLMIITHQWL